jgi:trimeric autotransporter adhesin
MKTRTLPTSPLIILVVLGCFALSKPAQAVNPPPDGGYPGGNTAEGHNALLSLSTGTYNTGVGIYSLLSLTDGNFCTGVGAGTLLSNTADENTATGAGALLSNTTGFENTATGAFALFKNTTGHGNTANGVGALFDNTTGNSNTANGLVALSSNTTGTGNIALGAAAGLNVTTANNVICVGHPGANVNNSCYIGNIFGATSSAGTAVFINSAGKLGTTTSSRRFKEEIKPMEWLSEMLYALKPVTFRYKNEIDPAGASQFGLVAEEVEKVNPDLVVRDSEGKPYTVRYDQVNAMLLNEFLKEHRKNEEQEKTIAELKSGMTALAATMKEQAAQIQKVSAQLEASKPAPQVVNNP